jgi:hypothetical protein
VNLVNDLIISGLSDAFFKQFIPAVMISIKLSGSSPNLLSFTEFFLVPEKCDTFDCFLFCGGIDTYFDGVNNYYYNKVNNYKAYFLILIDLNSYTRKI